MNKFESKKKFNAALTLLSEDSTNKEKFESIRNLIGGLHAGVDRKLELCANALSDLEKIEKGDIILVAENLPENSDEQKKRKKALLLFIKTWKDLKEEVERVKNELENNSNESFEDKVQTGSKILATTKGPFGIITIIAIVVAGVFIFTQPKNSPAPSPTIKTEVKTQAGTKTKVITFKDKKIPLTQLTTGIGPECLSGQTQAEHYHAKDHQAAKATDGSLITDPGGCGFGKVDEVKIEEISSN